MRALYDFTGKKESELNLTAGDEIVIKGEPSPDWIEGELNGKVGVFPRAYVQEL